MDRTSLSLEETPRNFLMWLNRMGIVTRYPEDLRNMIKLFSQEQTSNVYEQTKTLQQWIKQQ